MKKTYFLCMISAIAIMVASLPSFVYVYLLFDYDYYIYDFILDDDTIVFSAFFIGIGYVCKIIGFLNKKELIIDFSIAIFCLILGWILAIFGLGATFNIYLLESSFYAWNFLYKGHFFGVVSLVVAIVLISISLIYFSKFYKKLSEFYNNKVINIAGILWIIGAIFPIFGGVILFVSSFLEFYCYKKAKVIIN